MTGSSWQFNHFFQIEYIGGYYNGTYSNEILEFNPRVGQCPQAGKWKPNVGRMLLARSYHAVSVVRDNVINFDSVCVCPWDWEAFQGTCYRYEKEKKTWEAARQHCINLQVDFFFFTNFYFCQYFVVLQADLVNIQSEEENEFISKIFSGQPTEYGPECWIGLRRKATDPDSFVWTDGTVLTYSKWGPYQPDNQGQVQECGLTGHRKPTLWDDQSCATRLSFVCEKVFGPTDWSFSRLRLLIGLKLSLLPFSFWFNNISLYIKR